MSDRSKGFDLGSGLAIGIALGIGIGMALDNLGAGVAIGIALGAGFGSGRSATRGRGDDAGPGVEDGAIDRGVLWLLVGLAVAVVLVLATAPELLAADPRFLGQLLLVALAAAIPGVLVFTYVAIRRRHRLEDEER